jgi:ABC-type amino acid transport substrate-binding protein
MLLLAACAAADVIWPTPYEYVEKTCDAQTGACPNLDESLLEAGRDEQIALQVRQESKKSKKVETLKLAADTNYPPYAFATETGELTGFGPDIANGMKELCPELNIEVVKTRWSDCWTSSGLGNKLDSGEVDACMTYTHTRGIRNKFAEFSGGILDVNKAAGLMTKLNEDGTPKVTGHDDLSGKIVADVAGWAPTADGLDFVENKCTHKNYASDYILRMAQSKINPNDLALTWLLNETVDAVFLYSDQAKNYKTACKMGLPTTWNCANWKSFGKKFAYVQTGQFGYVHNGTTLALAKKGSGVAAKLNPCLDKFMQTAAYYGLCVKHGFVDSCYPNKFFPGAGDIKVQEYNKPTKEHTGDCSSGYCPCT